MAVMRRPNRWLLLLLLPLIAAGCKSITIDSPQDKAVYETVPDFKVTFQGGAPTDLTLTLNGNDVKALFTVTASGATAPAAALAHLFNEGDNSFAAKDGTSGREITFVVDTQGPAVHITSVGTGNPFQVQGRVVDPSGVQSLAINGQAVPLQNNLFTATVTDAPFVSFQATDGLNHTSATKFARPGTVLASTTAARLNKSGIGFLVQELNAYIATLDYNAIIKALNPLFDEGSWAASARVDATSVTLDQPSLSLVVSPNAERSFDVGVQIGHFTVNVHASGTVLGIPWSADGQVWATLAVFGGRATVSINDTKLAVGLSNISSVLNGFGFHINGFPSALEQLFYDVVKPLIEDAISSAMATRIPPYIEQFLKDIPSQFTFSLMGASFEFAALPASLKTFLEGLTVQLGGWLQTLSPAPQVPLALGSRFVDATPPDLDVQTPGGTPYDAGAAMSLNLVNQGLLSAYQAGLLNLVLDGNSSGVSAAGLADVSAELEAEAGTNPMRFQVVPSSPPWAVIRGTSTALASLGMDEFDFRLEMLINNEWKLVFGAHLDMTVPFDVGVTQDNKLKISFEQVPTVKVWSVDDGGIIQIDPAFVQTTLDRLLPRALPYLANIIEEIPIPSYAGYGIHVKELWPADVAKAYLGIAGDLIKTSLTAAAAAPETSLALDTDNVHSDGYYLELYPKQTLQGKDIVVPLSGRDPLGAGLEYSFQLDGGPWTVWKAREEIRLSTRALLSGQHTLEVRARTLLLKEDPTPAKLVFATGLGVPVQGLTSKPAP
jgi:hypothetical protein